MATINFLYRSTKDEANLMLRLLFSNKSKAFVIGAKTKFRISKEYWSKQHKKDRLKDIDLKNKQVEVNIELNNIEQYVLRAFNSTNIEDITKEWLQALIDSYYNPIQESKTIPTNLIEYIDFHIDYRKHELSESSIKKFNVIKHKLERLQKYRRSTILIRDINDNFKNEFVEYCKSEKYAQNTIQRELVLIKTFCKHARFLGLETHNQLDSLRLDREKVEKIYLTIDELNEIEKTKLDSDTLLNVRDWLIISCFTGQRVSDFMHFTKEMIRVEDDTTLIEFTQKKTNKKIALPLHPKVINILKKRNGDFPYRISDQRYNEYIKEVCKLSGLTDKISGSKLIEIAPKSKTYRKADGYYPKYELVTSHIGRRSFATNLYGGKIPTTLLMSATGHTTEAMFLEYIGKTQTQQAKELAKYF